MKNLKKLYELGNEKIWHGILIKEMRQRKNKSILGRKYRSFGRLF